MGFFDPVIKGLIALKELPAEDPKGFPKIVLFLAIVFLLPVLFLVGGKFRKQLLIAGGAVFVGINLSALFALIIPFGVLIIGYWIFIIYFILFGLVLVAAARLFFRTSPLFVKIFLPAVVISGIYFALKFYLVLSRCC